MGDDLLAALTAGLAALGAAPSLAFERGGAGQPPSICVAAADGSNARQLGTGAHPLLSPDGHSIAAATSGAALTIYTRSGATDATYFSSRAATATPQAWSSDSRYLAVVLASTNPKRNAASGLAVIDTSTRTAKLIAHGSIYGASFAPGGRQLVYGQAARAALSARVDLHTALPDGTGRVALTRDGRSLYPVWGAQGIAYDREHLRRHEDPSYQVWLLGRRRRRLTHVRVPPLDTGLVPLAFDANGTKLLAEFEGAERSSAWLIDVGRGHARQLRAGGQSVTGAALSRDGSRALVDRGGYLNAPSAGTVLSLPLAGGSPQTLVVHGSEPSWNL